jgi:HNH endonuclease
MDVATRRLVWERADSHCEYCHLRQDYEPVHTFHIEHIVAKQHRGSDALDNLALACHLCNWHKGPNLTSLDPDNGIITPLFHPRRDTWADHFKFDGAKLSGLTDIGRTTIWLLEMNCDERLALRAVLIELGEME